MSTFRIGAAFGIMAFVGVVPALATGPAGSATDPVKHFRQLEGELPSPNIYRSASGAPGPAYWQQEADYVIDATLDEDAKTITATQTITYTNNSPDTLSYLWVALDLNRFKDGSTARTSEVSSAAGSRRDRAGAGDSISFNALRRQQAFANTEYGFQINSVTDEDGRGLAYVINDTMMRIDLADPLDPEETFAFSLDWENNILDENAVGGRGGYETLEDGETIFFLAQWFPRMAAYTDYTGWQNKQFLGRGEFTLEFGDYDVSLTLPADHIVSSTGVLQNPEDVLTREQRRRLDDLSTEEPRFIVTPEEAEENAEDGTTRTNTWRYRAENVRDFAWSSSRKYIWDAMIFEQDDAEHPEVLSMSFYPPEAEPIWSQYSTQAVVHTMEVYNKFAFNYPYPVAQSVNSWERGGMEYPMITFNGYRPSAEEGEDGVKGEVTYSRNIKYGLIGVIIHEIGHIYFPMVVNSDERRHTWMDEGLNTFLEYMAEYEWEEDFPILGNAANPLDEITRYMTSSNQVPIMTQSDSVLQFGPNAYSKPASALVVLRETVMGRELFDFAFREYAQRWKFKRPQPADFFRTMEDASAVDLDWFWRGWFFDTGHVDIAITGVREYQISTQDPDVESSLTRDRYNRDRPGAITAQRNREEGITPRIDRFTELRDLYNENDKFTPSNKDRNDYQKFLEGLEDWERAAYDRAMEEGSYLYFLDFASLGGLVSPLPLTITYDSGEVEELMIPAEIWRRNAENVTKLLVRDEPIISIVLDAAHQTADADHSNNTFPASIAKSRFEIYKSKRSARNLMSDMMVELKSAGENAETDEDDSASVPLDDDMGNDRDMEPSNDNTRSDSKDDDKKSALRRTLERIMKRDGN